MTILSILIVLGAALTAFLFRKGGVYDSSVTSLDNITTVPAAPYTPASVPVIAPSYQTVESTSNHVVDAPQRVYDMAYSLLEKHLTLNDSVSPEVGCAEALSFVLKNCGYDIPQGGIPSVAGLTDWMVKTGFQEVSEYGEGYVIVGRSPTDAHIGICGKTWIMSNSSNDVPTLNLHKGLFEANYHLAGWKSVFPNTRYFEPV